MSEYTRAARRVKPAVAQHDAGRVRAFLQLLRHVKRDIERALGIIRRAGDSTWSPTFLPLR